MVTNLQRSSLDSLGGGEAYLGELPFDLKAEKISCVTRTSDNTEQSRLEIQLHFTILWETHVGSGRAECRCDQGASMVARYHYLGDFLVTRV